jgi:uncharacterized protein YjdB
MKRGSFLIAALALLFFACKGPLGPAGKDGADSVTPVPIADIAITSPGGPISYSATLQFTPAVLPVSATNQVLTWSVVDQSTLTASLAAVIDSYGVLIPISSSGGTVIVTATAEDGSGIASNPITIHINGS